ncbi:MAG TPA: CoA pyrophosphatase [Xanthomonadales bacterium]|nr:CoA pyrophosphatase [Xanthomonadales bacterium]
MNRDALRERLRRALHPLAAAPRDQPTNYTELRDLLPDAAVLRPAAVLVPIVWRAEGAGMILTLRTDRLTHHGGQISFPGGCVEPGDADVVAAAAREAWEEIGLEPGALEPLGFLDRYATITGFDVTPVIALVDADARLVPDPGEVAEVFEVPLQWVLDPARQERRSREFLGRVRHYHAIEFEQREIWGATASMIVNLAERLQRSGPGG